MTEQSEKIKEDDKITDNPIMWAVNQRDKYWIKRFEQREKEIIKLIEERRKKIEGLWKSTGVSDYYYYEMVLEELKAEIKGARK